VAASRRYTWRWQPPTYPCDRLDEVAGRAQAELDVQCLQAPQYYSDPSVTGTPFGFVEITLTVSAKGHWKIPWRIRQHLLPQLRVSAGLKAGELEEVGWERLPPHRHPHRAARWRGKTEAPDP
jgi:hypothetical protein